MKHSIRQRVQQLVEKSQTTGFFKNKKISIESRIDWGTVNECWVLICQDKKYLARLGQGLPEEFISTWRSELKANLIAADARLAPRPLFVDEDELATIYPWCGEPLNRVNLTPALLKDITNRLSLLHCIEPPVAQVTYRKTIENYLNLIGQESDWAKASAIDFDKLFFQADQWDLSTDVRFCHHDLNPGNILWDGERCTFIDWEYARIAHPLFDIASLSKHFCLSDQSLDYLLDQYHRRKYSKEEVKEAEIMVNALDALWLEAARLSLFNS